MKIDFNPAAIGDLNMAVKWEVARIRREANGDPTTALKLGLGELVKQDIISDNELRTLSRIVELDDEIGREETTPERAYIEVRRIHYELLRSRNASPFALSFAARAAASYISIDENGGESKVVFAKAGRFERIGQIAGGVIGGALGGADGAVIGGQLGGEIGGAVDECLD